MQKNNKNKGKKQNKRLSGIIKVTAKPIGFVVVDKPASATHSSYKASKGKEGYGEAKEDIIVFEENLNCALDKDEVEVEIIGKDRDSTSLKLRGASRKKGRVTKIIKRNKLQFVGTLEKNGERFVFAPDDWKFYRKINIRVFSKDAKSGEKALVVLKKWNNQNLDPDGEILKIIGKKGEHETEMQSILLDKGIVYNFSDEVEKEAEKIAEEFKNRQKSFPSESLRVSSLRPEPNGSGLRSARLSSWNFSVGLRTDFRDITTFTIDPSDAKDFDDALSYEEIGENKIRVGVHIADVSYFVEPGTLLDREALRRSFSTYLVDRTIPMLPEVLSNDLCSLMPNKDRFAFSAVFDIKKDTGEILDRWFGRTIINSNKRFSYEEAQQVLDGALPSKSSSSESHRISSPTEVGSARLSSEDFFQGELSELNRLADIYRAENKKNGAIEFETDEVKFELDGEGKPIKIYKKARLDTMKMIEEWMLLANREVAKFISDKVNKKGGVSIFRTHNLPKMEKIEELAVFVRAMGYDLPIKNGEVDAKDINLLLSKIEGHASESLIKTATIRSMSKAEYSTKNIGHFGLAFEYYTHFTSPIRRYPDLMIQRILDRYLKNEAIPKNEIAKFEKIANEASEKEIRIAEAERDSIKYKQVEFMQNKVGQEFDCIISGVTEWGMYVEDPETKVEGLVRIKDLSDDFYKLDQKNYAIVGEKTKKKFSIGDIVHVKLIATNLDRKTLDFKLV